MGTAAEEKEAPPLFTGATVQQQEAMKPYPFPITISDDSPSLIAVPDGYSLESSEVFRDEFREYPRRIRGESLHQTEGSFIDHLLMYKTVGTRVFADPSNHPFPMLRAVYDYDLEPAVEGQSMGPDIIRANWRQHTAVWNIGLSKEWTAWVRFDRDWMSHVQLAEFLEERVVDVLLPDPKGMSEHTTQLVERLDLKMGTPSMLVMMSRNLTINADVSVQSVQTLSSGEVSLTYMETHKDGQGAPIKIPNAFLIGVPFTLDGPLYQILVRLAYRIREGKVMWSYRLHALELVKQHAFDEIVSRVAQAYGQPVFIGRYEGEAVV